jgi:hypothetical protein
MHVRSVTLGLAQNDLSWSKYFKLSHRIGLIRLTWNTDSATWSWARLQVSEVSIESSVIWNIWFIPVRYHPWFGSAPRRRTFQPHFPWFSSDEWEIGLTRAFPVMTSVFKWNLIIMVYIANCYTALQVTEKPGKEGMISHRNMMQRASFKCKRVMTRRPI